MLTGGEIMNKLNKEQLQSIVDNAPEGATHVSNNGVYYKKSENQALGALFWWRRGEEWIETKIDHLTRSLSDIKTIIEQQEEIERLKVLNNVETLVQAFSENMQEVSEKLIAENQEGDELVVSMVLSAKKLLNEFMVNYRLAAKGAKD